MHEGWLREDLAVPGAERDRLLQSVAEPMCKVELAALEETALCWYPSRMVEARSDGSFVLLASEALRQRLAQRPGGDLLLYFHAEGAGYAGRVSIRGEGETRLHLGGRARTITVTAPEVLHRFRRREHERLRLVPPLQAEMRLSGGDCARPALVEDLSISGARVRLLEGLPDADEPAADGPRGTLAVVLADGGEPLCCEASIAWRQDTADPGLQRSVVLGVSWPHLPAPDAARLSEFLAARRAQALATGLGRRGSLSDLLTPTDDS